MASGVLWEALGNIETHVLFIELVCFVKND